MMHWAVALTVIIVSIACKFFGRGLISSAAILIGLLAGYALAFMFGMVNFGAVGKSAWITGLQVMPYGFEFSLGAVIVVTLVCIVSAIETVGDATATTQAGAGRIPQPNYLKKNKKKKKKEEVIILKKKNFSTKDQTKTTTAKRAVLS